ERQSVGSVEVDATLDRDFFPDGVITNDTGDTAPTAGPADAANHVRHVAVNGEAVVERRRSQAERIVVAIARFESDCSGEAVAAVEGVGDLVGSERTVGNETVVRDARRVAGEGREQRVGLTDAETAELDIRVL